MKALLKGGAAAVVQQVLMRGELQGAGVIQPPPTEHSRFKDGRFYVAIYTLGSPRGDARAQLR